KRSGEQGDYIARPTGTAHQAEQLVNGIHGCSQRSGLNDGNPQQMHAAAVGVEDAYTESIQLDNLVALGQMAEGVHDQAAEGVELLIGEVGIELLVELFDRRQALDQEVAGGQFLDVVLVVDIVLVLDVADDLLQYILDGDQTRHAAIFVDDDGHMVMGRAKFLEQHIQPLGLGHTGGRAQHILDIETIGIVFQQQRQQILGQQDAEHVVDAFADHREAGVRRFDDRGQEFTGRLGGLDGAHLRTRDHDVPYLHVGDLQGALDDRQRLDIEDLVALGLAQQLQQLLAVAGFMDKSLGQSLQPGLL